MGPRPGNQGFKRRAEAEAEDNIVRKKAKLIGSKKSKVSVVRKLGNGAAGTANLVEETLVYAVKEYDSLYDFEQEKRILERLQSIDGLRNRIPTFLGVQASLRGARNKRVPQKALASEYIDGKTLYESLPDLRPGELGQIKTALEKTLGILHVNGITHDDTHGNNVLLRSNTALPITDRVVLIDFSHSSVRAATSMACKPAKHDLKQLDDWFKKIQISQEPHLIQQLRSAEAESAKALRTFITPYLASPPQDVPSLNIANEIIQALNRLRQITTAVHFLEKYSPDEPHHSASDELEIFMSYKICEAYIMCKQSARRALPLYRKVIPSSIRLLGCGHFNTIVTCANACRALIEVHSRFAAMRLAYFALRIVQPLTRKPSVKSDSRERIVGISKAKSLTSTLIEIIRECIPNMKDKEARLRLKKLLNKYDSGLKLPFGQHYNEDKDMMILLFDQIWGDA